MVLCKPHIEYVIKTLVHDYKIITFDKGFIRIM